MTTKTKVSGFFIVEIMIVLLIANILAIALMPRFTQYIQQALFSDNVAAATALKPAVEFCTLKQSTTAGCSGGTNGVPANVPAAYGGYVNRTSVTNGVITITSTANFGTSSASAYTYILTPTFSNNVITWTASGTCAAQGLCPNTATSTVTRTSTRTPPPTSTPTGSVVSGAPTR